MPTNEEYREKIHRLGWKGLQKLWQNIIQDDTPGWDEGKAFEYLVLRMFELDNGHVKWPYSVQQFDTMVEQIDGSIQVNGIYCLVESKDEEGNISIEPIAKLRNQLLRRPSGTVGLVFSSHGFTDAALQLSQFMMPQAILLWTGGEVEKVLRERKIAVFLEQKYRACVDEGMTDFNITVP